MLKKIILILVLMFMIALPVFAQSGTYTTNGYFYLPAYGSYGTTEFDEYNLYMQKADTQIEANKDNFALYYLKTEINTQAKVETIWGVSLVNDGDSINVLSDAIRNDYIVAIGLNAGIANTTGDDNVAIGNLTLYYNTTGTHNIAIGDRALFTNVIGNGNTAVGVESLSVSLGDGNTALGCDALLGNISGNYNVGIGRSSGYSNETGSNNVFLGYHAGYYETASNAFYVDNQDRTNTAGDKAKALLYGVFDADPSNQTLTANAAVTATYGMNIPTGQTYKVNGVAIDLSLYYLKTEINTQAKVETIWGVSLVNDGDLDLYYLKTAIDTQGEVETIWGDTLMNDLVDDTSPELGGQLQSGAHSINFTEQVLTSGAAIAWNLGNSNKATLTAAHAFTITITPPSGALNAQLIITQDGTGTRVMDEIVTQSDATIIEADVHIDTEIIDLTVDIPTGARIRFKTSGVIPTPLVADTIYWAIRTSENHIQVATTKALAMAGTAVNITDDGTDTQTVQQLVKWTGGTLGVLTTDVGAEDILGLTYKTADKQWYAQLSNDFQ